MKKQAFILAFLFAASCFSASANDLAGFRACQEAYPQNEILLARIPEFIVGDPRMDWEHFTGPSGSGTKPLSSNPTLTTGYFLPDKPGQSMTNYTIKQIFQMPTGPDPNQKCLASKPPFVLQTIQVQNPVFGQLTACLMIRTDRSMKQPTDSPRMHTVGYLLKNTKFSKLVSIDMQNLQANEVRQVLTNLTTYRRYR